MKKLFAALLLVSSLCPLSAKDIVFNLEAAMKEYKPEISVMKNDIMLKEGKPTSVYVSGSYETKEYVDDYLEVGGDPNYQTPKAETKITLGYEEVTLVVPAEYQCEGVEASQEGIYFMKGLN